ncbi:MAG: hypothetical protein C0518_05410 [Opitutus sp.]|nr:hypothetical protein [Opitutus sp.]
MSETLYLVLQRARYGWRGARIAKVSKKRPTLSRPSEQALVKLSVVLPDNVLQPREVRVEVKSEHIVAPTITVTSQPAT